MSQRSRSIGRWIRRLQRRGEIALRGTNRVKVVVLGHQKGGTTAVAALLARAAGTDYANDPLHQLDWGRGLTVQALLDGERDLESVVGSRRSLFCSTVLKDPDLTFVAPECAVVFANARLVHVVRDPRDTIRSIADRLGLTSVELGSAQVTAVQINPHWQAILDGGLPSVAGGTVVERLALRWRLALERVTACQVPITVVRYEDFRRRKAEAIVELAEELGLAVQADIGAYVDIQFQPPGSPGVCLVERLGRANVRAIEALCEGAMTSLGYETGGSEPLT